MRIMRIAMAVTVALMIGPPVGAQPVSRPAATDANRSAAANPSAAALEPRVLRQATFNIPFSVDTLRSPREVQLYVSVDAGQTWKLYDRQKPESRHFQFRAGGDGQFWFVSRTIDADRVAPAVDGRPPELHVVVDTTEPELVFKSTVGSGGEVVTSWRVTDLTLDANSLKVEYQAGTQQEWMPVAVERAAGAAPAGVLSGTMTWWPQTDAPEIKVRAEVADRAGNKTVVTQQVRLPSREPAADLTAQSPWPSPNEADRQAFHRDTIQTSAQRVPLDPYHELAPPTSGVPWPPDNAERTSPQAGGWPPAPESATSAPPDSHTAAVDPTAEPETAPRSNQVAARQVSRPASADRPATPQHYGVPRGERPRMTSSKRFQLEYEVDAMGANGVREVELWGTSDDGRTWTVWQTDPDRESPMEVEVQNDGVYGFRIVIVGNNGLAGPAPRNGDLADLWVGVDATAPAVSFAAATYGQGEHAGQLDIRWSAQDAWFGERPMTLLFSDRPDGPWTTIAAGLPNTGQYYWPIDPRIPDDIYLRVEARDEAGNLASDQLRDTISISGLTPRAHIRGIRPLDESPRGAFRNPFFR